MKKSFARVLSIALAVALVITCAITGLVMPTAANTEAQTSTGAQNLLAKDYPFTLEYGTNFSNGGRNYDLTQSLATGDRLVFRFEAKGAPVECSCSAGTWSRTEKTTASADWRIYQQTFPVTASYNEKTTVWVSWNTFWAEAQEGDKIEVRNLQIYKITSELNLIPDGDMNNGGFMFLDKSASALGEGAVRGIVEDPTGDDNLVYQLAKNNPYWNIGNVVADVKYDGSTIYKLRFRMKGDLRLTLGYSYLRLNNVDSVRDDKGHVYFSSPYTWKTYEFYTAPTSSAFSSYLQFCAVAYGGSSRDLWIDDVELYEVGVAESWTVDETVKIDASWGTTPLARAIKTTPANSYPFGVGTKDTNPTNPFTWTLTGGTTKVTLSNATNGWLNLPSGSSDNYSLANEKPEITVTDGTTTKNFKVEWIYPDRPIANATFNDVVGNAHAWTTQWSSTTTWATTAGKGMDGSPAGYVTKDSGTVYINQRLIMKPNTVYRFSMLAKASSGTIKVNFSGFTDCTNSGAVTYTADGKWNRVLGWVKTGAAPVASYNSGINIRFTPDSSDAAPEAIIDDVMLEEKNAVNELVFGGDFDVIGGLTQGWGSGVAIVDASQAEGGSIGGNTTNVLKIAVGQGEAASTAVPTTYFVPSNTSSMLKVGQAYKITFKHYGGKATFNMATWLGGNALGGGGKVTCQESTEWTEYSLNYVPGPYAGDLDYRIRLANISATADAYFDDIRWEEIENTVYAPYSNEELGVGHSDNFWISGKDAVTGETYSGQRLVWDMSVGTKLYFTFIGNGKVIPIPSSLKVHYADGTVVPILNTSHTPMTGSAGTQFGPIEVREGTAYIEYNFAPESTGYQWGTLGSAVRRDADTEEVNGIRFLNRLYMNGLDWANAEGFTVTIDGKEWTVKEIGALARVATDDDTVLDVTTATKRGICYAAGGNGVVRVTDYTQRYFDFTVVIPVDAADYDTEYEFGAYMVLTDGTTEETVYTEAMTDSVTAALGRGA